MLRRGVSRSAKIGGLSFTLPCRSFSNSSTISSDVSDESLLGPKAKLINDMHNEREGLRFASNTYNLPRLMEKIPVRNEEDGDVPDFFFNSESQTASPHAPREQEGPTELPFDADRLHDLRVQVELLLDPMISNSEVTQPQAVPLRYISGREQGSAADHGVVGGRRDSLSLSHGRTRPSTYEVNGAVVGELAPLPEEYLEVARTVGTQLKAEFPMEHPHVKLVFALALSRVRKFDASIKMLKEVILDSDEVASRAIEQFVDCCLISNKLHDLNAIVVGPGADAKMRKVKATSMSAQQEEWRREQEQATGLPAGDLPEDVHAAMESRAKQEVDFWQGFVLHHVLECVADTIFLCTLGSLKQAGEGAASKVCHQCILGLHAALDPALKNQLLLVIIAHITTLRTDLFTSKKFSRALEGEERLVLQRTIIATLRTLVSADICMELLPQEDMPHVAHLTVLSYLFDQLQALEDRQTDAIAIAEEIFSFYDGNSQHLRVTSECDLDRRTVERVTMKYLEMLAFDKFDEVCRSRLGKAMSDYPKNTTPFILAALGFSRADEMDDARGAILQALMLEPRNRRAQVILSAIEEKVGDIQAARDAVLVEKLHYSTAFKAEGEILDRPSSEGDFGEMITTSVRADKFNPTLTESEEARAQALERDSDLQLRKMFAQMWVQKGAVDVVGKLYRKDDITVGGQKNRVTSNMALWDKERNVLHGRQDTETGGRVRYLTSLMPKKKYFTYKGGAYHTSSASLEGFSLGGKAH